MEASAENRGGKGVQEALFGMMVHTKHACIYMYNIYEYIYMDIYMYIIYRWWFVCFNVYFYPYLVGEMVKFDSY